MKLASRYFGTLHGLLCVLAAVCDMVYAVEKGHGCLPWGLAGQLLNRGFAGDGQGLRSTLMSPIWLDSSRIRRH